MWLSFITPTNCNPIWACTTIGAQRYASLTSARKVGSELPPWLLAAPCQMWTGRCKHFRSRWSVTSLVVFSSYPAVAQTEFDWHQSIRSFESLLPVICGNPNTVGKKAYLSGHPYDNMAADDHLHFFMILWTKTITSCFNWCFKCLSTCLLH